MLVTVVFIIILFGTSLLSRWMDRSLVSAPTLIAFSLLSPVIVFSIEISFLTSLMLVASVTAFSAGYFAIRAASFACDSRLPFDSVRCDYAFPVAVFWLIGQVGLLINLGRVVNELGPSAYWSASFKEIELVFGASAITNYLFFVNIAVAVFASYLVAAGDNRKVIRFLLLWSLFVLTLSGIKSTFLFGLMMVVFAQLIGRRLSVFTLTATAGGIFAVVLVMFLLVNFGLSSVDGFEQPMEVIGKILTVIKGYIYFNYINLDLELALRETFTKGQYTFFFVTKLLNPGIEGYFQTTDFILMDRNYNMGTFVREYFVDFGFAGALLVIFLIGSISGIVASGFYRNRLPAHAAFYAVILTASAFAFFGNQFIRLQFFYVILISFLIEWFAQFNSTVAAASTGRQLRVPA